MLDRRLVTHALSTGTGSETTGFWPSCTIQRTRDARRLRTGLAISVITSSFVKVLVSTSSTSSVASSVISPLQAEVHVVEEVASHIRSPST
eukprot:11738965-Heterocapsa_arctica.AAC.1